MNRREFITLLAASSLSWPLAARAQQGGRLRRIGMLETIPAGSNAANFDAFRRALRELGYVEGQNLAIEYRSADGVAERFPALAAELVRLPVDVIVTRGTPAALAAKEATNEATKQATKQATATIPVVMAAIGEPLGVGVVASLAHPGGNVTGFSAFVTELSGKRVEMMKEAFPAVARAGFLNNMSNPVAPPQWEATQVAARALGVAVELLDVRAREDIPRAFAAAADRKLGALLTGIEAVTQANAPLIIEEVARLRIPAIYPSREFVDAGGLMAYSVSYPNLYRRAAGLVDKIFKGARAGDLPVEQPTKLDLVINLKTAKALGLELPPMLIARADEVIE